MSDRYGMDPTILGEPGDLDLSTDWHEFMHFLYLPVRIPLADLLDGKRYTAAPTKIPPALGFLHPAVRAAVNDAVAIAPHLADPYVYVTAVRGYASPGNPLNRPGWHTDDFGGTDLNYIWTDAYPTKFLLSEEPLDIPVDDAASMDRMERYAACAGDWSRLMVDKDWWKTRDRLGLRIVDGPTNTLLRLNPYVIHAAPHIPAPGGMRSFFKISVSTHRYDLLGNSHNHDLAYDWPMYKRRSVRNQPQGGDRDYTGATR